MRRNGTKRDVGREKRVGKHKKGRAIGGLVMGVRKELVEEKKEKKENQEEGMIVGEMKVIGEKWAIIGLYVNGNMERKMKRSERKNRGGRWRLLGRKGRRMSREEGRRTKK